MGSTLQDRKRVGKVLGSARDTSKLWLANGATARLLRAAYG